MKSKIISLLFIFGLIPFACLAQVDSTAADTLPMQAQPDTITTAQPDTLQSDSATVTFKVRRWKYHAPLDAQTVATDSTLRWQVWPSWVYKKNREPGVITYRMGTIGRTNAMQVDAHEPKYQQLYWQDIRLNDPISGIANWNYIPHHKIDRMYEEELGTVHRTTFDLNEYYLNKPLTRLNYTESSYDTRNLEFVVSANLSQKTNAEISYWDRRDGGEYNNSGIVGSQIYARVTHQLDQQQLIEANFLNNRYDNSLPFGYNIGDPESYNFDRFLTSANESSGDGNRASSIIGVNYYRRPADSSKTTNNFQAGIYTNGISRDVSYNADTTSYNVRALGANMHKWQQVGPVDIEGMASYEYFMNNSDGSTFNADNWGLFSAETKLQFQPLSFLQINGSGKYRNRSDGFNDYRTGVSAKLSTSDRWSLSAGITSGSRMPTPQQLYWQGDEFAGDPNLRSEKITALNSRLEITPFTGSTVGVKAQLKQIENGIMIGEDSTFTNVNSYSSLSTAAYFDYEGTRFEFSGSATFQQFGNYLKSRSTTLPVDETERIWFKGSAYVKGYLFDRATYVKAGLSGMITPQAYRPARYYPSLDFWQSSGNDFIPSFNRLDVDFSARVRKIIVLLRYENVLDGLVQQGYFETAGYPMTSRRFIFGIRVFFRN